MKSYKKYLTLKPKKSTVVDFWRQFTPEMVFRTMKLEGEPVTRKNIFSWLAGK